MADPLVSLGLLAFGLSLMIFRREISVAYTTLAKKYFAWEPTVDLTRVYLVGGALLVLVAVVGLVSRLR
jgi:hypothetical protein